MIWEAWTAVAYVVGCWTIGWNIGRWSHKAVEKIKGKFQ